MMPALLVAAFRRLVAVLVVLPALAFAQPQLQPQESQPPPPLTAADFSAFADAKPAAPAPGNGATAPVSAALPKDLSVWGMFVAADLVVQGVMVGLAFASVLTWTVFVAKLLELGVANGRQRRMLAAIDGAPSLADAPADPLVRAAREEWKVSDGGSGGDRDGLKERVASRLERLEAAAGRRMLKGTGLLATIGATAPFVGLFGTVWGIMNSFIGISKSQTTNLAVVAPGIAEALLATALGLAAAIPAVVIYNHFARRVSAYRALVGDTSAAVLRLVSRDVGKCR
jgi:biopolymer transport protein ExbB